MSSSYYFNFFFRILNWYLRCCNDRPGNAKNVFTEDVLLLAVVELLYDGYAGRVRPIWCTVVSWSSHRQHRENWLRVAACRKQRLLNRFYLKCFSFWQSLSGELDVWPFTAFGVSNVQGHPEILDDFFGSFSRVYRGREESLLVQSQPTARD